jgi:hypothetical protein
MTGPQDPAAAGEDRLLAGHADRERVIEALKDAFMQGRLTGEELGTRTGQALAARTYAELNTVTADIPGAPRLHDPPDLARRWPLATAAVKSGCFLAIATAIAVSGNMIDNSTPNAPGPSPHHGWTRLLLLLTLTLMVTALVILGRGVAASVEQRRSRKQLPPRSGPGAHALDAGLHDGAGHDLVPPGPRTDQTGTDLQTDSSRPGRLHSSGRGGRAPRGIHAIPDGG